MKYVNDIYYMLKSIFIGMWITMRYLVKPKEVVTLQYPREKETYPPRHRGVHELEPEKCIMCNLCANNCPVSCIDIESTRHGHIEGGTKAKNGCLTRFTVDYGKCLFCGLCIEGCPEDCIHMGAEHTFMQTSRDMMEKNLLTNEVYTSEDNEFVVKAREDIKRLAEEAKAAKKAKRAKGKAATVKEEAPKKEAPKEEEKKEEPKEEEKKEEAKKEEVKEEKKEEPKEEEKKEEPKEEEKKEEPKEEEEEGKGSSDKKSKTKKKSARKTSKKKKKKKKK